MRSITKQLDMSPGAVSPVVHVSQYDSDFTIVFTLYCTDGTFTLESGTTAEIRGTKKSGTGYSATATVNISAKTVTVAGHKQMTAVAGDNIYEITLYKGSKELNSINFVLAVERAAMDQDTVVDETTIREFGELETYIEGVKADTAASASAANASKNAAAQSATNAANSAIEAAQSAQSVDAERLNRIAFGSYVVESQSGPIAHFEDGADNIPMKDVLVHIEPVQEGSGDPSPDNVRPITGWTGAKVTRCGKNLTEPAFESATKDGITAVRQSDGSYVFNGKATRETNFFLGSTDGNTVTMLIPRNTPLAISGCPDGAGDSTWRLVAWHYKGDTYLNRSTQEIGIGATINDAEADGIRFAMQIKSGATCENLAFKPMLRLASDTDATYEPYSGQTYDITFPSEAGTVYGGTLDVTSGVMTVDRQYIELNGTNYTFATVPGYTQVYAYSNNTLGGLIKPNASNAVTKAVCNYFPSIARSSAGVVVDGVPRTGIFQYHDALNQFRFALPKEDRFSTRYKFQAWLQSLETPLVICIPLKEPLATYQLTPQEITSLLGTNNLWADTGDSEVEYRADTKMYVDAKVAAAVSALS